MTTTPIRGKRGGSTRQWRKIRAFVLERDAGRCQLQLDGCASTATEAHHVNGWQYGDDPARIVAACRPCNLTVGDPLRADPKPIPRTAW